MHMATTREIGGEQHESAADAAVTDARAETADAAHAAAALEAVENAPATAALPAPETLEHDLRRRRPPALSFLRRFDTLRRALRIITLIALDALGVYAALLVALAAKAAVQGEWNLDVSADQAYDYWTFAFLITALLFARSGLYANRASRPGLRGIVSSLFWVMIVTLAYAKAVGEDFSSYYIFWGSLLFATVIVSALRWGYDLLSGVILRAAGYHRRAVLVGTSDHLDHVGHALRATPSIEVVGFISLTPRPDNGMRSLGKLEDLGEIIEREGIDEVIIADPAFPDREALELVNDCHERGVRVRIAPSTMEILAKRADFVPGQTLPLFELRSPVFEGFDYIVKRAFDLAGAALLMLFLSPVLALSALAVKLTSRGPVFYRSWRPGIGGERFACLKFRTMYVDAEDLQPALEEHNEAGGALFKIKADPRVTPAGRFLRRFSLDELPQLWNVLSGEMSLVGPRPLPQRDYDRLEDWHRKRNLVLPGMTGLWQVSGRAELGFDDLVRLDFFYLENWSVSMDLSILVKTIPAVLRGRGAF
jgi:exopolysaccharide biosynthesis polyprenyl glycosylphosphotransferase